MNAQALYQALNMIFTLFLFYWCEAGHFNTAVSGDFWSLPQVAINGTAILPTKPKDLYQNVFSHL